MTQTTWATAADVQTITGATVTDGQVTTAGFVIDNFTGRPYSFQWTDPATEDIITFNWFENVGAVDMYYLKLAVAYQVVWMTQQPDLMTRMDLRSVPTTRATISVAPNGLMLGPLAKKALSRVSWLRSRALHVRSPFEDLYTANSVNFGEFLFPWAPIGGNYSGFGFPSGPDY